ncbi:MAG: hypothetical protein KJZ83_18070 [Burkholderiaceae bacterium]|nr:hypothetical protein [Burkholderiaceae bacterium]
MSSTHPRPAVANATESVTARSRRSPAGVRPRSSKAPSAASGKSRPPELRAQARDVQAGDAQAANDLNANSSRKVFNEPRSMLEAFLVTVVRLAGARAGAVRALTAESDEPRLIAAWGVSADALEGSLESCGGCGGTQHCELGSDPRIDPRIDRLPDPLLGQTCAGSVAIPLEYKGRSVGVCTLFFDEVNSLRPEVIHLLRPVGQLFGLALENAKLEREKLQSRLIEERQAMAGEIHDSLAQSLTFVRMRMPLLASAIEGNDSQRAAKYCSDVTGELGSVNRRMRELITHFRAGMDAQGLERALEGTARSFFDDSGIRLTLENDVRDLDLDAEREVQVFRIVQEALANVRKHSNARNARVRLARQGRELRVTIEDDGAGIAAGACAPGGANGPSGGGHFGIEIMRERAATLGGRLEVGNSAQGGTIVTLALPARESIRSAS